MIARLQKICPLILAILLLGACRQQRASVADIQLLMSVSDMRVGETTLLVTVSDKHGERIANPGRLRVRGDMDHAGMAPVMAESASAAEGIFSLPFEWTMAGGWIVEARLTLADGTVTAETFRYEVLNEAMDMPDMEHRMPMGESSAVYMRIRNLGTSEIALVAASSPAAMDISFHQTMVENDMARMESLAQLRIAAGESIELAPGGRHIMLGGLTGELAPGSHFQLQLRGENGKLYELDIPVMTMPMKELDASQQIGTLEFSAIWARPASAGMMISATPAS